jgi:Ni,Fe-hydrogenase maturation factor
MGLEPGAAEIFPVGGIGGLSASTHSLPLRIVVDYLLARCPCEVVVVGIQPERLDFDGRPSRAARAAARRVAKSLAAAARAMRGGRSPRGGR